MGTKNSSFTLTASALALVFLASCTPLKTRNQINNSETMTDPKIPAALERPPEVESESPIAQTPAASHREVETPRSATPKIGVILGGGGVRAYSHVGLLQEWTKMKLPIHAIVGIEMGALAGAIYAQKAQPFDVEWQLMKLKSPGQIQNLLNDVFKSGKTEDFRVSFACPAYNLAKSQSFMMNRGQTSQMLPYCLPTPPMMKPYSQNVASLFEIKTAADYLRSKGATYIVYVHVLAAPKGVVTESLESERNIMWSMVGANALKQAQGLDLVVQVPLGDMELSDWGKRRDAVVKGLEAGQSSGATILKKLGL